MLGDALGNIGVIATGLFIWLTKFWWRFYFDPVISFLITCIIFSSALPLVRSASVILLQGTPAAIPLDQVRAAILRVPNVEDVHGQSYRAFWKQSVELTGSLFRAACMVSVREQGGWLRPCLGQVFGGSSAIPLLLATLYG